MKKSLTAMVSAISVLCLVLYSVSCSQAGLKNELTKYYQSEWSRLADNYSFAHFKSKVLVYMEAMENCPYAAATERDAVAEKLAQEYCANSFYTDLADVVYPFFEERLSVVEFKKINAAIKDEAPLAIMRKIDAVMQREFSGIVNVGISSAVADIMNGETPMMPSLPEDVAEGYLPAMERFYDISGRRIITEKRFSSVKEMISQEASESQVFADNFFEYLGSATPVMMCIAMQESVGVEELNMLIEIFERPEFGKLKEANIELSNDIASANKEVDEKFDKWLKSKI
jgi:hypothetical protein